MKFYELHGFMLLCLWFVSCIVSLVVWCGFLFCSNTSCWTFISLVFLNGAWTLLIIIIKKGSWPFILCLMHFIRGGFGFLFWKLLGLARYLARTMINKVGFKSLPKIKLFSLIPHTIVFFFHFYNIYELCNFT